MSWKKAARAELERRRAVMNARRAAMADADPVRIRLSHKIPKAKLRLNEVQNARGSYRVPYTRGMDSDQAQAISDGVQAQFERDLKRAQADVDAAIDALERHEASLAAALPPIPDGPDLGEIERAARALDLIDNPQMFVEVR